MPTIMDLVWRRHLGGVARRRIVRATAEEGEIVCVGFADLVGFTAQTQELHESELADVVGRFETIAYDLTAEHEGRVVKMIGDEVMFMTDDVASGAALAVDMASTFREDEALSDVRVGLASGRVLERDGDVYGTVVNLASRVVGIAYPGAVVVSQDVHEALESDDEVPVPQPAVPLPQGHRARAALGAARRGRCPGAALRLRAGAAGPIRQASFLEQANRKTTLSTWTRCCAGSPPADFTEEATTEELEAISDAVLDADIDHDLQVELLADIETSRRLHELEAEANTRADQADLEAERAVSEAEAEARRKVELAEAEAHRKVEQALSEAEEKSRRANEAANRKVAQALEDAERKADKAKRDARRKAKRKAERKKPNKPK